MESITENGREYFLIHDQYDLDELIHRISVEKDVANLFKFSERNFFIALLETLKIGYEDFTKKYFHYDSSKKLHISESEFGYVWISTYGLIAVKKATTNRAVNSCLNQYLVISLLFKKAIEVVEDERVYDIDSYSSGLLKELTPAIFHNLTFYIEVFCKAYLSLTETKAPHTHSLALLYQKTVEVMLTKQHNDSLFQIMVLEPLYKFINHVSMIPGNFKEQFIKYDDNPLDSTIIIFEKNGLIEMTVILELSVDFIADYFYEGSKTHYLKTNTYQRMLEKADTVEKKQKIREMYSHLVIDK